MVSILTAARISAPVSHIIQETIPLWTRIWKYIKSLFQTTTPAPLAPKITRAPNAIAEKVKRVVLYYSDWSMYDPKFKRFANEIPTDCVTDVNYAFMNVSSNGDIALFDPWSDIQYGTDWQHPDKYPYWGNLQMLHQVKLKAQSEGKDFRTYFSVGGWGRQEPLAQMAKTPETRARFIQSAIKMCETYDFDGIDIDWEYPTPADKENFMQLLRELKAAFDAHNPPLKVTLATAAGPDNYNFLPWGEICSLVERVNIMTYDFHGPWGGGQDPVTNHQSALKKTEQGDPKFNVESTIDGYLSLGADPQKLSVGMPLYFRTYAGVTGGDPQSHLNSAYSGPGRGGAEKGIILWREGMDDVKSGQAQEFWDEKAGGYSIYYPGTQDFGTGINETGIEKLAELIRAKNLAGGMIWEFKGDDANCTATRSLYSHLNGSSMHPRAPQRPNPERDPYRGMRERHEIMQRTLGEMKAAHFARQDVQTILNSKEGLNQSDKEALMKAFRMATLPSAPPLD
jgi:chitinase